MWGWQLGESCHDVSVFDRISTTVILKHNYVFYVPVPTQKMARMLYSSVSAMRKFQQKADCMGIDTHALEFQDVQVCTFAHDATQNKLVTNSDHQ